MPEPRVLIGLPNMASSQSLADELGQRGINTYRVKLRADDEAFHLKDLLLALADDVTYDELPDVVVIGPGFVDAPPEYLIRVAKKIRTDAPKARVVVADEKIDPDFLAVINREVPDAIWMEIDSQRDASIDQAVLRIANLAISPVSKPTVFPPAPETRVALPIPSPRPRIGAASTNESEHFLRATANVDDPESAPWALVYLRQRNRRAMVDLLADAGYNVEAPFDDSAFLKSPLLGNRPGLTVVFDPGAIGHFNGKFFKDCARSAYPPRIIAMCNFEPGRANSIVAQSRLGETLHAVIHEKDGGPELAAAVVAFGLDDQIPFYLSPAVLDDLTSATEERVYEWINKATSARAGGVPSIDSGSRGLMLSSSAEGPVNEGPANSGGY